MRGRDERHVFSAHIPAPSPGELSAMPAGCGLGGVALLTRDGRHSWTRRDERDLSLELSKLYGYALDSRRICRGVDAVANALRNRELARAQIAALLLQLPDPPASVGSQYGAPEKRRLVHDLVACGLLKADADGDEKHPRTGAPPNPG
jgi:hypothetical protein